jgi:transglutaminase-like putative cysteine protease
MNRALLFCLLVPAVAWAETPRRFHIAETFTAAPDPSARERSLFIPLPQDDPWQTITGLQIDAPFEVIHDPRFGDAAARVAVPLTGIAIHASFEVERRERSADLSRATGKPAPAGYARWLADDARVHVDDRIRKIAADQTQGLTTPLEKARALYAYVLKTMRYEKKGEGWGRGDIIWACDKKYGNCTDFHALLSGLLRAAGVPARFQIGYSVPQGAEGEITGYHCWMDFYLDGVGWVPVDASEAWKHPEKRDYFFGHHDSDRVALSTGRDVTLPGMRGNALNYFVYPYLEDGGKPGPDVARQVRYAGAL